MVTPSTGSVVLVRFPFSDLSKAKIRPAVVLAGAGKGDWILCQVTSNAYADPRALRLTSDNFDAGSLHLVSYARPGKLFTANKGLMVAEVGILSGSALALIVDEVIKLLHGR